MAPDKPTPVETRWVLLVILSWAIVAAAALAWLWLWLDNGVSE
jgi:hypothetical protein